MKVVEITPTIGVEFTGVGYAELTQDDVFNQVIEGVQQHELAVVRGIELTPQEQIELAAKLGKPVPFVLTKYRHPEFEQIMISSNEVRNDKPIGIARVGNFWHQDSTFVADPAPYTMLHGVTVPSTSGHTLFASAVDVYDRLPDMWKKRIADRTALHTVSKRLRIRQEHVGLSVAELRALIELEHPRVEHPLVKHDPFSGRPYLYGAPEYMDSVVGFDANENEEFFGVIDALIQDEDHVYTHRWTTNDLVIWKTRTTYHAATEVEAGAVRTVHRVSIESGE